MCRGEIPQGVFYFHPSDEGLALRPNEERSLAPSSCPSNVTVAERLCHTEKVVGARTSASRKGRSKANTASPVTPCGKSQVLKGHDFSRAVSDSKQTWALVGARTSASRKGRSKANTASPVTPCGKSQVLKGHDFSRAVSDSKQTWALVGARTGASRKGRSKANTASPVTPCGKSQVLKGHDFSRAVSDSKQTWALAPEGWFFGIFDFHHGLVSILYAIRYSKIGPVAQRLEQGTHNPLVRGSNPCRPTRISHG